MLRCIDPRFNTLTVSAERVQDIVKNVVDPPNSHILILEIKPYISKYIPSNGKT